MRFNQRTGIFVQVILSYIMKQIKVSQNINILLNLYFIFNLIHTPVLTCILLHDQSKHLC